MQEFFHPGSLFSVKELHLVRGVKQTITFYAAARLDGLVCREELYGIKMTEQYTGREDHLVYRSATFSSTATGAASSRSSEVAGLGGGGSEAAGWDGGGVSMHRESRMSQSGPENGVLAGGSERQLPIAKITEKFTRNGGVAADGDVAKRVFYIAEGKTLVQHHLAEGNLTGSYMVFQKDGAAQAVQVGALCLVLFVVELHGARAFYPKMT
jgi:hypothetical protein